MSEPVRWTEREIEVKPERVEHTATYEELLADFDGPCLVRSLVERCQALEAEVERLHQPVEVVVKLDTKAVADAVVTGLKALPGLHEHTWREYDGAFYCYGCKTFMRDRAALAAFDPTEARP